MNVRRQLVKLENAEYLMTKTKKIIAIASEGGHWLQLMQIREAFEDHETLFVTTMHGLPEESDIEEFRIVPDCNRDSKVSLIKCFIALLPILLKHRPDVVVSTGALPGVIAMAIARVMRSHTIWIDSVANAEEMSMSGRLAKYVAVSWMSQWEHVAKSSGAVYAGEVL